MGSSRVRPTRWWAEEWMIGGVKRQLRLQEVSLGAAGQRGGCLLLTWGFRGEAWLGALQGSPPCKPLQLFPLFTETSGNCSPSHPSLASSPAADAISPGAQASSCLAAPRYPHPAPCTALHRALAPGQREGPWEQNPPPVLRPPPRPGWEQTPHFAASAQKLGPSQQRSPRSACWARPRLQREGPRDPGGKQGPGRLCAPLPDSLTAT